MMWSRTIQFFRTVRIRRFLIYGSLTFLALLLFVTALVAALPSIVSTRSGQTLVRQSLEKSLKRKVSWSHLALSWSTGLAARGFTLGPGQAPLLKAAVGEAFIVPKIGYSNGRVNIVLGIRVSGVAANLAPGPPKPPPPYKEPLTALADALQSFQALDWPLPVDLSLKVAVDPVRLSYRDPQSQRTVALQNGSFLFDVPSLAVLPITAKVRGDLSVDGRPLPPLSLTADLKDLVSAARRIHPAAALVAVEAALPGTSVTLKGGLLHRDGIALNARVDLPRVMTAAAPFLPATLPAVHGQMTLDLKGKVDKGDNLHLDLGLTGSGLAANGGRIGRGGVGPLALVVKQQVDSDLKHQQVRFAGGSATIDNWLAVAWHATIDRPSSRERDLSARLGPIRVDLARSLAVARPFLPPDFPVRELAGELNLREVAAQIKGKKDRGEVTVSGLSLRLPRAAVALAAGTLSAVEIAAGIDKATVSVAAMRPTKVDAYLSYGVRRLALTGKNPVTVDDAGGTLRLAVADLDLKSAAAGPAKVDAALSYGVRRLALSGSNPISVDEAKGTLQIAVADLDLKSASPRKFAATGDVRQSLAVRRVTVAQKLSVENARELLATRFDAQKNGEIIVSLDKLELSAASLNGAAGGNTLRALPLSASVTAAGIRLPAERGATPYVERVACELAGEFEPMLAQSGQPSSKATPSALKSLGKVPLTVKVAVAGIRVPSQKDAPLAVERAECSVNGELKALLAQLTPPPSKGAAAAKIPGTLPLVATVSASGIVLPGQKGGSPSLERAACSVTGGDFLKVEATGELPAHAPQKASTSGTLRADLDRLIPIASPFLPKGVAAGGTTSLAWKLALPVNQKPPQPGKNPIAAAKGFLALLDRGDVSLTLATRDIRYPLAKGPVTLADLHTTQPVRLLLPGEGGKVRLEGGLSFAGLAGLPGSPGNFPAQSGTLSLMGEVANWQSLRLHEELKLQQFGVVQRVDAAIGRLDALMEKGGEITAASLLQRVDAVLSADLAAHFPATPTPVPGGAKVSGEVSSKVAVNLAAGRDLKVRATAAMRDFGCELANGTKVEGARGELLIDRSYALAKKEAADWTPLSASLVRPAPELLTAGSPEMTSRVREDLQGEEEGSRRFTVRRLAVAGGTVPIELTSLEGDLLLTPQTMGLSFLQTELLGGTLRMRALIDLKPEVPVLVSECSFSNLQIALLLSPEHQKTGNPKGEDTQLTGELGSTAPLATAERELLEGARMRLNLRRIGANTLERALFSLDPYERNEQLVAQRKMLRSATLKGLRGSTLDGAVSLEGEVRVKGVDISLPKVERIRLSELQLHKQMEGVVAAVVSARKILDLLRSDTVVVGAQGDISLVRRGHEK